MNGGRRRPPTPVSGPPRPLTVDSGALDRLPPRSANGAGATEPVTVERAVKGLYPELSWNQARALVDQGKVCVEGEVCRERTRWLEGATVAVEPGRSTARKANPARDLFVHVDSQVVVVNKPAGIATVPFENSERNSLDRLVQSELGRGGRSAPLHVVHRLDKETSGVLVFARTDAALKHLKNQFRQHTTERRYVALAHGQVRHRTITSRLVPDRGDGLRGSTKNPSLGREATTHVRALRHFPNATEIECRLETGRTHQIRIHLSESGHPLLGERVYVRDFEGPRLDAPRVLLHAQELGFAHPTDERRLRFEVPPPADYDAVLARLLERGR